MIAQRFLSNSLGLVSAMGRRRAGDRTCSAETVVAKLDDVVAHRHRDVGDLIESEPAQ